MLFPVSATDPEPGAIAHAAAAIGRGGIVAYPTDTLYGLAVDPRDDRAVAALFDAKGRSASAAIPLIAAGLDQAEQVAALGPRERMLAARFWPGPLTIVVRPRPGLSPLLLAGGETVAIRVPDHAVARALARAFGFCVTATSANASGAAPPASAREIDETIRARAAVVLDGGPTAGGPPSTIVELAPDGARLIRPGAIAWNRVLESLE